MSTKGNVYIDPTDIVGKQFGPYKVDKYLGIERSGQCKGRKYGNQFHMYSVVCTTCGYVRKASRGAIIHQRGVKCRACHSSFVWSRLSVERKKEVIDRVCSPKARENLRTRSEPYKNNKSTGIKRYHISKTKNGYLHTICCTVDKKRYIIVNMVLKNIDKPFPELVEVANELNKIIAGGKENFKQWYSDYCTNRKALIIGK